MLESTFANVLRSGGVDDEDGLEMSEAEKASKDGTNESGIERSKRVSEASILKTSKSKKNLGIQEKERDGWYLVSHSSRRDRRKTEQKCKFLMLM